VWALALHGRAFVDGYFLGEVLERSRQPILHLTRFSYYVRELWRSEGPLVLLALAGIGWAAVGAARRRRRRDLLISIWALGGLVAFSLARTRFDYYLLVVYPALALGAATLVWTRLPLGKRARLALAIALIGAGALAHLARDLSRFDGDDEVRALARVASAHEPPEAELYLYNTHPYSARYYSERKVVTLLESPDDFAQARALASTGMPISVALAPELPAALERLPRPFALLLPRARANLLRDLPPTRPGRLTLLGETRHYLLFSAD
jgi:4-amino-4-deoxy-L-arabinose transferase-like glycosyltransferase